MIYTKGQCDQAASAESLSQWGQRVGLGVVQYDDWTWEIDHAYPDALGQMPTDIWAYMPSVDARALHGWFHSCEVVVVLESDPGREQTAGVRSELYELSRREAKPAPATVLIASLHNQASSDARDQLGNTAREILRLSSPQDDSLKCLVAVAWVLKRLERSGPDGMRIVDAAQRASPYLNRFVSYGPHWTTQMLDYNDRYKSLDWWSRLRELDEFMHSSATGVFRRAWSAITQAMPR